VPPSSRSELRRARSELRLSASCPSSVARVCSSSCARVAARERRRQQLERQLAGFDLGRRLAAIGTRLIGAETRLRGAGMRRQHLAAAQLTAMAGRLETLSPLAVLGRGYAVAWNADKTRALRDAAAVDPGDRVHVTLSRGSLECDVRSTVAFTKDTKGTKDTKA